MVELPRLSPRVARSLSGGGRFRTMRRSTAAALFLLLACLDARAARAAGEAVRLPGWQNGVYLSSGATQRLRGAWGSGGSSAGGGVNTGALGSTTASTAAVGVGASSDSEDTGGLPVPDTIHVDPSKVTQISWEPRAYLYRGFLRRAECDYIIQTSASQLRKSTVVDNDTGKSVPSAIRTSDGSFIARGADEVIADIERRIAEWSHVPVEHGEGMQVLRYEVGQKYEAHMDAFSDAFNQDDSKGGQRVATVLMYLSDVEEGGETVFPHTREKPHADDDDFSPCARQGVAVKARRGDALLFWSMDTGGKLDLKSTHAGCSVVRGVKWSATKWMHVGAFAVGHKMPFAPGVCDDEEAQCAAWARAGECEKNPSYMVGLPHEDGHCMRSCGKCPAGSRPNAETSAARVSA